MEQLRKVVHAKRLDDSIYKFFKFQGVQHAREMIGEHESINLYETRSEYTNKKNISAEHIVHLKSCLEYANIKEDKPFAVIHQYGTFYTYIDETMYLIYGCFNSYHGYEVKRWEVFTQSQMKQFITIKEAEDVLYGN